MIQHLLIDRENCISIRSSVRYENNVWAQDHPITGNVHIDDLRRIMDLNEEKLARKIGRDIITAESGQE